MKAFLLILILTLGLKAQYALAQTNEHPLFRLEKEVRKGSKTALIEVAKYLDSKKTLIEFQGRHSFNNDEAGVARRIINENCMFRKSEIEIDKELSTAKFLYFLHIHEDQLEFYPLSDTFIITPFKNKPVLFEIKQLTDERLSYLNTKKEELMNKYWISAYGIDKKIEKGDPTALLTIATILVKERGQNKSSCIDQLELLTHSSIAVSDGKGSLCKDIKNDNEMDSSINLLLFLEQHLHEYQTDSSKTFFENKSLESKLRSSNKN